MLYKNILTFIGNTPIVKINKLNENRNVNIYAKLEGKNPGGSVKDRIALSMIEAAEKSSELTKNKIILEPTSGNTGIGLALVGAVKGYRVTLTMSAGMSDERKKILKALGAELILTSAEEGTDGAIKKAHTMLKKEPGKYWMPNQFDNPNNPLAHYNGTGVEIINQMPTITHFVAGMGTGGTLMGTGKRLKEYNPDIKIIGIEPQLDHKIAGLKNMKEAIVPKIYDEAKLDKKIVINNEDAYETARQLAKQEGIFVGMSAGAAMYGAMQIAKQIKSGNMVIIFPDRGEKYLSTILFN
ncbi:MAG: cysteine synthase family protein [Patescibacteria group bacterium]|jgi:cysteine synthase